jgi:hypothetical protein
MLTWAIKVELLTFTLDGAREVRKSRLAAKPDCGRLPQQLERISF